MAKKKPSHGPLMPSGNITERVRGLDRWRDTYNPLRRLTIRRATTLLESYARGAFTELMWTFAHPSLGIETLDADLSALITRRIGAIKKLDWDVKAKSDKTRGFDQTLAEEQTAKLREVYERIDNLPSAIEHLCLSTFRGFSLLEMWEDNTGALFHLEAVNHWHLLRDGCQGGWKYNPNSIATTYDGVTGEELPEEQFMIRESARPLGMLALLKYVRGNMAEKNWDAFLEIYGLPGGVVTQPPNVPADKEADYQAAAKDIAQGGSGSLPHGATYTANDSPRGTQPFKERLDHLSEKLVLAGTGGKLTMLASATGIGGGPSEQQEDVFADIAQGEAADLSMIFQKSIDAKILSAAFPGQPQLAYFEICAREETDVGAFVTAVGTLGTAGYEVSPIQIKEKTGMEVTVKPIAAAPAGGFR